MWVAGRSRSVQPLKNQSRNSNGSRDFCAVRKTQIKMSRVVCRIGVSPMPMALAGEAAADVILSLTSDHENS